MSESFGRWQLDAVIAVGGVGEIWRARGDAGTVAIKRLHSHLVRLDDIRGQFALEQRLTTELPPHARVVRGVEAGEVAGRPYLALELAPGEDLRRTLAPPVARGASQPEARVMLPRARVRAIVLAVCDAAAHLHAHGYVHGDINPGNLVVTTDDRLTLVDLGIARPIGGGGTVRGTHAYMAPEQVRGEPWTPATDVFAIGVVLWELSSAARLFHRGPPWLSMAAVVEAPVPPLDDPALDAILQAALTKDPAHRLATATELADRLRDLR
jgi:eukaryotic-like serine/threonine-protein kinase